MRFEIHEEMNGEHYFLLQNENGQTMLRSEPFMSRRELDETIELIKEEAAYAEVEEAEIYA